MRVLGIDPGSETTGWGLLEGTGRRYRLIEYGVVKAPAKETFAARLERIADGLDDVISRLAPDTCAIEEAFYANNVQVAIKLGQVRGAILLTAQRAGLDIHEYAPRLVKQTVVGYGNADKAQVQEMVKLLLSLPCVPQPHDAADALALAICHFHHAGTAQRLLAAQARLTIKGRGFR